MDILPLFRKIKTFSQEVVKEVRHVVFPTRPDVIFSSIIAFLLAGMFAVFFFIVDQLVVFLIQCVVEAGSV